MSAKERLSRVKTLEKYAKQKQDERAELLETVEGLRSMSYGDKVDSSRESDRIGAAVVRLQEISDECAGAALDYCEEKDKIINEIQDMRESKYSFLLYSRYIEGKDLLKISFEMNYSYEHIRRLHGEALRAFDAVSVGDGVRA